MMIVSVMGYDCCQYTHSIWVNADLNPRKVQLPDASNDRNPDKIIRELKKLGFKRAKIQTVEFGGNF